MAARSSDREIRLALQAYFRVLQSNPTAEEMRRTVVTNDFKTGFAGGYIWQGPNGLRDFLAARAGFVREQHDVDQVLERKDLPTGEVRIKTRLTFSLRQPPGNELFTGTAFHTWLLRRDAAGQLRVAAQIVDGFSNLNENATRLFATPDKGLQRRDRQKYCSHRHKLQVLEIRGRSNSHCRRVHALRDAAKLLRFVAAIFGCDAVCVSYPEAGLRDENL